MSRDRDKLGCVYYDRPVQATLLVRLENGDTFEAGPGDLHKWGYVRGVDVYRSLSRHLTKVLDEQGLVAGDLTSTELNPVRHLAELAATAPDLLEHPETEQVNRDVVEIEQWLRKHTTVTEEMARLVIAWESRARRLRQESRDSSSISPEHRQRLIVEAGEWEAAAFELRGIFDLPADPD